MRRAVDADLVAGAIALAYRYATLSDLREVLAEREARPESKDGPDLVAGLVARGSLPEPRAEKVRRAARLAQMLKEDAVYGMIALRNRLVGTTMLNACMEESRRTGWNRRLSDLLLEKGVVTQAIDKAIGVRAGEATATLTRAEDDLRRSIDLAEEDKASVERRLAVLFGEVASKLMFLTREELESCLVVEERVRQGLPAEVPQEVARPPDPTQVVPLATSAPRPGAGPSDDEPIKGYELLQRLGSGAMGAVVKARKKDTGETVAIKILKPELAKDLEFVQRFNREALAVQALNHPNVIRAVQVGRSGDFYFFAMEFVDGESVSSIIKTRGKLPERFALSIVRQVAGALDHAWRHRIIHRDIKPDNIMVTRDGNTKLTDLGLARTVSRTSTLTVTGVVVGSPAYISPEQATGEKNLDTRSDIYALGASLYHMLAAQVPYDGDTPLQVMLRHMNDPLPDVRLKEPSVSEHTRRLIMKMMAKRPEARFQTPRDLQEAIVQVERALAAGTPAPPLPAAQPARPQPISAQARRPIPPTMAGMPVPPAPPSTDDASKKAATTTADKKKELGERLRKLGKKRR